MRRCRARAAKNNRRTCQRHESVDTQREKQLREMKQPTMSARRGPATLYTVAVRLTCLVVRCVGGYRGPQVSAQFLYSFQIPQLVIRRVRELNCSTSRYKLMRVKVSDTPGAGNPHFRDLQTIENDVRKTEKAYFFYRKCNPSNY